MPRQGRAPSELRQVRIVPGFTEHAEGSVLCTFGRTRVLCTATAEERVPSHVKGSGRGWVTAEYGMLPRATHTRTDREAAKGKQTGRTQEIQRLIGRALRAATDLPALRAPVAAVSVGIIGGEALLDLDYEEDFAAEVDMNVVGNAAGELLEVQGTAEKRPFTPAQLTAMVVLAQKGMRDLHQKQLAALAEAAAR